MIGVVAMGYGVGMQLSQRSVLLKMQSYLDYNALHKEVKFTLG